MIAVYHNSNGVVVRTECEAIFYNPDQHVLDIRFADGDLQKVPLVRGDREEIMQRLEQKVGQPIMLDDFTCDRERL